MLIADHLGADRLAVGLKLAVCLVTSLNRLIRSILDDGRVHVGRHFIIASTIVEEPGFIAIVSTLARILHVHRELEHTALVDTV